MFSAYVQGMMERYAVNPLQNWKEKDCVLYLHTTLAPKQPLGAAIGSALVVQSEDINAQPVFKADAIKFVTTFRVSAS